MPGSAGAPVRSDPPVTSLRALYEAKLADGLRRDLEQEALVARLDDLRAELDGRPGALARLLPRRSAPRGVYVWGEVGRGKSMLVDALMATLGDLPARRIHFHAFMRDLHRALHDLRREGAADPIVAATDRVAGRAALLALDELEITDIVDAMIVGRVFERLLERRIALVVTSNRAPVDLYRDGLKRDLFLPFTRLIEDRLDVIRLDGGRDYRRQEGIAPDLYLTPEDGDVQRRIAAIWRDLPGETEDRVRFGASGALRRKGRAVRAGFDALCRRPVAAAAYLDLAAAADLVLLAGVPRLSAGDHDAARRFVLLIDTLYDARCGLVVGAQTAPQALYVAGEFEEEFRRTVSRLHEMTRPGWPGWAALR